MIMTLAKSMPVKTIASFVDEHDTRLWRVLHHYVDEPAKKPTTATSRPLVWKRPSAGGATIT
jgi:hypothetical protein